jgi:regulatory protein
VEARRKALGLLARRDYAVVELAERLSRGGYPRTVAEAVVAELAAEGLADDGRFAGMLARHRAEQGYGPRRIEQELRQRGVSPARVDEALAPYREEWQERMEAARSRRFGPAPGDWQERLRQARFLEQRGFAREAVHRWLGHRRGDEGQGAE